MRSEPEPAPGLGVNTGAQRRGQSRHIEGVTSGQLGIAQLPLQKPSLAPQQATDGVWTPTERTKRARRMSRMDGHDDQAFVFHRGWPGSVQQILVGRPGRLQGRSRRT